MQYTTSRVKFFFDWSFKATCAKPIKFNSNPTDKEVKIPPKRKTAKAKKPKGTETKTNKITNYFSGATAAADDNSNNTKAQSEEDDESDVAKKLDDN